MPKRYGAKEFHSDPMQFMNNNILIPIHAAIGMSQGSARIRQLTLVTGDPVSTTAKKGGSDIEVFYLRPWTNEDPSDQSIFAYWCPYAQEQTLSCMLGNGARYMFTAVMDGCSFGVGSQKDGSCLVGHANTGTSTRQVSEAGNLSISQARYQQRITQRNKLWSALGGYNAKVISPTDYMIDTDGEVALKATTFGLHELGKNWDIFTQRWIKPTPRSIVLRDVTQQHAG